MSESNRLEGRPRDVEELLSPSLEGYASRPGYRTEKPWQLGSQFWVAFFGGVLASTVIAYLNGRRLGLREDRQRWILLIGAIGMLATVALSYVFVVQDAQLLSREQRQTVRIGGRVIAVLAYLIFYRLQRSADRIYHAYGEGEYASLWKPGLAAVFGLGLLQTVLVMGVVAVLESLR